MEAKQLQIRLQTQHGRHLSSVSQCRGVIGVGWGDCWRCVSLCSTFASLLCNSQLCTSNENARLQRLRLIILTLKELSRNEALDHLSDERVDSPRGELSQTIRLTRKGAAIPVSEEQRTNSCGLFFSAADQLWTREF